MKTFETVGNITVEYVDCTYMMSGILGNLAYDTDNQVEKAIYNSMNADKIYITSNSQGYYEDRGSYHSVTRIKNLAEIIPLMIAGNDELKKIWNNGIDKDGDNFTSPCIEDLYNCFENSDLHNYVEEHIDRVADDLMDNIINAVENRDESDYKDAHNHQAFEKFKRVNNIESDESFYQFDYENSAKDVEGYTQITNDQYEELYVKLPELVEHKRDTLDDGVLVKTEIFYTFNN